MKTRLYALLATLTLIAGTSAAVLTTVGSETASAAGPALRYSVPGVINQGALASYFTCTSTAPAAQTVSVTAFDNTGATAGSASLSVNPHSTAMFGTRSAAAVAIDALLPAPSFTKGSAQIASTSPSLICSAMVLDFTSNPPTSMVSLPVIKGVKQKGQ